MRADSVPVDPYGFGKGEARFTALRVSYLVNAYSLRPRFERLRARGLLTKQEAAARLKIHVATLISWAKHGIVTRYAYNAHAYLYDLSDPKSLAKTFQPLGSTG